MFGFLRVWRRVPAPKPCLQHFQLLTAKKPPGRRWVTKEQYIRYFMLCYDLLYEGDDDESSPEVRRASLEVRANSELRLGSANYSLICALLPWCSQPPSPPLERTASPRCRGQGWWRLSGAPPPFLSPFPHPLSMGRVVPLLLLGV